MKNIMYMLFIFNIVSTAYARPSIQELEESAKYENTYRKYASKENIFSICEENETKGSFAKCANEFMSKYNLQHEIFMHHVGITGKFTRNFYRRLAPEGYVVLSIKNEKNTPTESELNNIVSYINRYFKVSYETKAREKCTDMSLPAYLRQMDRVCFNKIVSKYGLTYEKHMHYQIFWLGDNEELFIIDNSNNKYPVVSLRKPNDIDSGMFWAFITVHNEYSSKCLSDLQKSIKDKSNCNTYHKSLSSILPYIAKYSNNEKFKRRMYYDSTPEDAKLYRENEILMRRIAELENKLNVQ